MNCETDMQELITVIVPVYNVDKYLDQCLQSICNQTYRNLEIIVIDDESKDNSARICDEYAERDNRIIVIHQKNQGVSAVRNTGIEMARGQYIGFVDGDDYIDENMYEQLLRKLKNMNADLISCAFWRVYEDKTDVVAQNDGIYDSAKAIRMLITENMAGGCSPCIKLYKRDVLTNIKFPVNRRWEDMLVMYKIYENAKQIAVCSTPYYYYVQHRESLTHTQLGIDDNQKITALYDRTVEVGKKYPDLRETEYNKVTLGAMQFCIKMYEAGKKNTLNYKETFQIGKSALKEIIKGKQINPLRKLMYCIFYNDSNVFYFFWKLAKSFLRKLVF